MEGSDGVDPVLPVGGNPSQTIFKARGPDGQLVWLEKGSEKSGLQHIIKEHANQFAGKGISGDEIPDALKTALDKGTVVVVERDGVIYQFNMPVEPRECRLPSVAGTDIL